MTRHDEIRASYRKLGARADLYDGIITRSSLIGKLVDFVVWGLNRERASKWVNDALSSVPEDFAGKLLEVPVGTGVLTMPLYRNLPGADITCLDYSADMMRLAGKRAEEMKLNNVSFLQGDVGKLPFADESFDLVLSLNGFHAFPDKDAAYRETFRVLKPDGIFCGCFYIAGEFRRTDRFVRWFYEPKGFFTPPFETRESLTARLRAMYADVNVSAVRAEGIFACRKGINPGMGPSNINEFG